MTDEEKKAAADKDAADVKAKADAKAAAKEPSEFEKQLAEKDDKIKKLTEDRDNYRRGLIAKKGKNDKGEDIELTVDEKIAAGIEEALLNSSIARESAEKDEIIKKALDRNKELETTIKNRSQITTTEHGGSNEQRLIPKDAVLSEDKIKELKARGWDDKKIELFKKNLTKNV